MGRRSRVAGLALALAVALGAAGGCRSHRGARAASDAGAATARTAGARRDGGVPAGPPVLERAKRGAAQAAGAVPAWTAVVRRAGLLARRGGHGAVVGRVAPGRHQGYAWLLDSTPRAAGLGIRLAFPGGREPALAAGQWLLVSGAWGVDGQRRWVWQVDHALLLESEAHGVIRHDGVSGSGGDRSGRGSGSGSGRAPLPADLVRSVDSAPAGSRVFYVLAPPVRTGAGWTIADSARGAPVAHLVLPGEAEPYGGQDYLSPDERWHLARGRRYAVALITPRYPPRLRPGELPVLRAASAPVEVLH